MVLVLLWEFGKNTSLEQVASVFAIGGSLAGILEVISQAKKALTKLAEKKENNERLANALYSLETLEREILDATKLGLEVSEIIQNTKEEPTITDAQKLYTKLPEILDMVNEIYSSFYELCREANVISKLAFMDEVRQTDRRTNDIINFLGSFYHVGKLNLKDLPMLISIFGPQRKQSKRIKKIATEKIAEIVPVLEKADRISKKLTPPIIRLTQRRLIRSLKALAQRKETFEKLDDETVDRLLAQSPDWMQSLNEIVEQTRIKFQKQMNQKGFRIPPK